MTLETEERDLRPVRCRTCGAITGYAKKFQKTDIMSWCSARCYDVPVSPSNEVRDEMIAEMFLKGRPVSDIADALGLTYQRVRQILDRRQLLPDQQHHDRRMARAEYMRNWRRTKGWVKEAAG
jgi:hypothetical protein